MAKIIDDKGRLFGKINVIDFLVILFLLCFAPMFYFGYKIFTRKPTPAIEKIPILEQDKVFIETKFNCLFVKVTPEVSKIISVGDKELDKNGKIIGEVVHIGKISPYIYEFNIGAEQKFIKEAPILKQVPVALKIKAEIRGDKLYYKDKQVLINSKFDFKTDRYQAEVIVLSLPSTLIEEEEDVKKKIDDSEKRISTIEDRITTLENKIETIESRIPLH